MKYVYPKVSVLPDLKKKLTPKKKSQGFSVVIFTIIFHAQIAWLFLQFLTLLFK